MKYTKIIMLLMAMAILTIVITANANAYIVSSNDTYASGEYIEVSSNVLKNQPVSMTKQIGRPYLKLDAIAIKNSVEYQYPFLFNVYAGTDLLQYDALQYQGHLDNLYLVDRSTGEYVGDLTLDYTIGGTSFNQIHFTFYIQNYKPQAVYNATPYRMCDIYVKGKPGVPFSLTPEYSNNFHNIKMWNNGAGWSYNNHFTLNRASIMFVNGTGAATCVIDPSESGPTQYMSYYNKIHISYNIWLTKVINNVYNVNLYVNKSPDGFVHKYHVKLYNNTALIADSGTNNMSTDFTFTDMSNSLNYIVSILPEGTTSGWNNDSVIFNLGTVNYQIYGLTYDSSSTNILGKVNVALYNPLGVQINYTTSDNSGQYFLYLPRTTQATYGQYTIVGNVSGYINQSVTFLYNGLDKPDFAPYDEKTNCVAWGTGGSGMGGFNNYAIQKNIALVKGVNLANNATLNFEIYNTNNDILDGATINILKTDGSESYKLISNSYGLASVTVPFGTYNFNVSHRDYVTTASSITVNQQLPYSIPVFLVTNLKPNVPTNPAIPTGTPGTATPTGTPGSSGGNIINPAESINQSASMFLYDMGIQPKDAPIFFGLAIFVLLTAVTATLSMGKDANIQSAIIPTLIMAFVSLCINCLVLHFWPVWIFGVIVFSLGIVGAYKIFGNNGA
jgi:hypothetical protein